LGCTQNYGYDKMIELPPQAFIFGNYNADIPFEVFISSVRLLKWLQKHVIIGYCKEPLFKPREGYIAVLIDLEGQGEYWSHIPKKVWIEYQQLQQ